MLPKPQGSGSCSRPPSAFKAASPGRGQSPAEEQAHLGSARGTWGSAGSPPSCQGSGHQALEEASPCSQLLPSARGQGLSGPLLPQPQSGSPQADALPRPRSSRAAPSSLLASPRCPAGGARAGGGGGPSVSVCLCVSVSHPALRGRCTGMLCPLGSVHTVKSNCLKAVVLGFVFFPPTPHFTQLERRCSLVSALGWVPAAWWPQPALVVCLFFFFFLPLFVVFGRRRGRVAWHAPGGQGG